VVTSRESKPWFPGLWFEGFLNNRYLHHWKSQISILTSEWFYGKRRPWNK
jgi:hypothetical protein